MARNKQTKQKPVVPVHLTWLCHILAKAYGPTRLLQFIGDIARLLRRKDNQRPPGSHTTCICCGGWIDAKREERGQHTCSEGCNAWYRRLRRAQMAAKYCRYCGRPNNHPEAVKRARPKPLKRKVGPIVESGPGSANSGYGAPRHSTAKLVRINETVPLVPDSREGVALDALEKHREEKTS